MLRGVLRPPLRPKTSTGSLAAARHPLGRNGSLIGLDAQSAGFGLPSRPALRAGLQRRALPSLWGTPREARPPLRRAAFATANACPCTSGLLAWVWTTHPAPASGLASGCGEVASLRVACRGYAPHPEPQPLGRLLPLARRPPSHCGAMSRPAGGFVAAPPASGCTCWGRFAAGVRAGRLYPTRKRAAPPP